MTRRQKTALRRCAAQMVNGRLGFNRLTSIPDTIALSILFGLGLLAYDPWRLFCVLTERGREALRAMTVVLLIGLLACAHLPRPASIDRTVAGIPVSTAGAPAWAQDDAALLAEIDAVPGGRQAMRGVKVWLHPGAIDCGGVQATGCCWWSTVELSSSVPERGFAPKSWRETALRHEVQHIVDGRLYETMDGAMDFH